MQLGGCRDRVFDHTLLRTIEGRRLVIAGCAATVVLIVLIGPGAVRPAGAGSLTIGAGSTMQLGDALVNMGCNDLIVEPGGTLDAQASTISSVGLFDNRGTFAPGTGTVLLCGGAPSGGGGPVDSDRDGIADPSDNCPSDANPDQADGDGDGVGDACDNCPSDFNACQTNVCGAAVRTDTAAVALSLKRLRLKAAPNGTIRITGFLDTTGYGGWAGFVQALRTRPPADASTPSAIFRQGNVFAFNVSGAGLAAPGQTLVFPACVSVAGCSGTQGEGVSFLRKGATNIFSVSLTAPGRTFSAPLGRAPATVTFSLDGADPRDQASCRTFGRGKSATCR